MTQKTEKEIYEIFEEYNNNSSTPIPMEDTMKIVDAIKNKVAETNYNGKVFEFMSTFQQEVKFFPFIPDRAIIKQRMNLLLEELAELAVACGQNGVEDFLVLMHECKGKLSEMTNFYESKKEVLDALLDLQYILSGTVHSFGMGNIFDEGYEIVHESNMTKLCFSKLELDKTLEDYRNKNVEVNYVETTLYNKPVFIIKREDGKVLKSSFYQPADFQRLLPQ